MALNFFKQDFSEVVGAYFDGEKIYLSRRLNDTVENIDANFSISHDDDVSEIEQLAEKISMLCSQRGWNTSKTGFCLREGATTNFQTQISGIPSNEIDDAVKTWANSLVGKNSLYASIKYDNEIWMEAILKSTADEYVTAWQKNSMTLCALTVMPIESDSPVELIKPVSFAEFVAEVVATKKSPNLLAKQLSAWNYKKISATIAALFFCAFLFFFAHAYYKYYNAAAQVDEMQADLNQHAAELEFKKLADENISAMKNINSLCAAQLNPFPQFNALVKLGTIADGKTPLTKLKTSADAVELEGVAENPDDIKNFVSRLKIITPHVKQGNFSSADGVTNFSVYLTLKK